MILTKSTIEYFKGMQSRVTQAMAKSVSTQPYAVKGDPVIQNYEILREVWLKRAPIKAICRRRDFAWSQYYEMEDRFLRHGVAGIFPEFKEATYCPDLERVVLMVKESRPSLSQQSILRVAHAIPLTRQYADEESGSVSGTNTRACKCPLQGPKCVRHKRGESSDYRSHDAG